MQIIEEILYIAAVGQKPRISKNALFRKWGKKQQQPFFKKIN